MRGFIDNLVVTRDLALPKKRADPTLVMAIEWRYYGLANAGPHWASRHLPVGVLSEAYKDHL